MNEMLKITQEKARIIREVGQSTTEVLARIKEPVSEHRRRTEESMVQSGLAIRELIQQYVTTVRDELPDVIRISYRSGSMGSHVDLNLNDWTFFFAGAQRRVDSSQLGDFWFEHYGSVISAIETEVLAARGIHFG